jgi:plastocyanin
MQACCLATIAAVSTACGGGTSASSPGNSTLPDAAAVVTITASGASPQRLTVKAGTQITFVNRDSVDHQMYSDPHPEHTDCTELDSVGFLAPGQSRQTGNLNVARTCGFHDHMHFENASLRGSIVVQ